MQIGRDDENEFFQGLGITDESPDVLFEQGYEDLTESTETAEQPEQEVQTQEPEAPVADPYAQRFAELERSFNDKLESLVTRLQPQAPAQHQQVQPQAPQVPQQPTRYMTDLDLINYNNYNQQIMSQQAQALRNVMVTAESQKLSAAKAELKNTLPDVFSVVGEDKIDAAFKHAMQYGKFDVPWVDQISTAYWRVKGPQLSQKQLANNEVAAKRAEKAKEAQRAIPAGGASYQAPAATRPAGNVRGFDGATAAFKAAMKS